MLSGSIKRNEGTRIDQTSSYVLLRVIYTLQRGAWLVRRATEGNTGWVRTQARLFSRWSKDFNEHLSLSTSLAALRKNQFLLILSK